MYNNKTEEYKLEDYLVNNRELKQEFDKEMKKQAITNYDKIRNMSVDDMAEFLDIPICRYCVAKKICKEKISCHSYIKQWLESEVEDDN